MVKPCSAIAFLARVNCLVALLLLLAPASGKSQSAPKLDSLLQQLSTAEEDTAKVWLLNDLSRIYLLRNVDSSNLLLKQAVALSEQIHFYKGKVASLHRLAGGTSMSGDAEGELRLLREALSVALEHDVKDWKGRCYKRIGDVFRQGMGKDSALHYYTLAENANIAAGTEYYNWLVFMEKAFLFDDQKQPDKTEHYFREALKLTSQRKVRMDHGLILFQMTSWYWSTKQWAKYSELSESYLQFLSQGDPQNKRIDAAHAMLYFFEENATPASKIPVLKAIVKQHETLGNKLSLGNTLMALGDFSSESGDLDGALAAQKQAAELFSELGYLETAVRCTKKVSDIYEAKKDYLNALLFFKKYQMLTDSLNSLSTQKNMQELEVKYETGKMEAEITQQQMVLEKAALARRNLTIMALLILLAGAGIALFLREKRRRAELNLQLEHAETDRLRELDQLKSAFFANISHEFRTPLTLLLGPLREMEAGTFRGDAKKYFGIMRRNAARLLSLVNQLLDLSRLESGKLQLQLQSADLHRTLRTVAGSFESLADQRQIEFKVDVPTSAFWVKFDPDKLEKIVGNLLSNAFKFTPEEGRVNLRLTNYDLRLGDDGIVNRNSSIVIQDTGIGIPPDQLPHIFERFYQVENTGADIQPGSGIGLALTKELVELHGGQISVESSVSPSGTGTTFTVSFNFEEAVAVEAEQVAVSNGQPVAVGGQESLTAAVSIPPLGGQGGRHLPLVLVAEDNPDVRSYILEQLQGDYRLVEARDGQQALDLALAHTPDLILTDLMMPVLDGNELTRRLKSDVRTNHIPVVMLTAKSAQGDRIGGIETGAEAYLTKPFDAAELRATLANLLAQRRILQEKFAKQIRLDAPAAAVVSLDDQFLQKVLATIEDHLDDETFGVEPLAAAVAMSRSNLFRKVEALLGKSPNQLIRERRLLRAKHLLESGAGNSTEVAFMTGFNSPSYFAKCFQEMFGEAPGVVAKRRG